MLKLFIIIFYQNFELVIFVNDNLRVERILAKILIYKHALLLKSQIILKP